MRRSAGRARERQEGKAACLRYPLILTETANPTDELHQATDPTIYSRSEQA
ncbi:MAG: hypothetical protein ACRDJE_23715 [Dehalococcoidia bacterium]